MTDDIARVCQWRKQEFNRERVVGANRFYNFLRRNICHQVIIVVSWIINLDSACGTYRNGSDITIPNSRGIPIVGFKMSVIKTYGISGVVVLVIETNLVGICINGLRTADGNIGKRGRCDCGNERGTMRWITTWAGSRICGR